MKSDKSHPEHDETTVHPLYIILLFFVPNQRVYKLTLKNLEDGTWRHVSAKNCAQMHLTPRGGKRMYRTCLKTAENRPASTSDVTEK